MRPRLKSPSPRCKLWLQTITREGLQLPGSADDEEDGLSFVRFQVDSVKFAYLLKILYIAPFVMKVRSRASSVISGRGTPGGGNSTA